MMPLAVGPVHQEAKAKEFGSEHDPLVDQKLFYRDRMAGGHREIQPCSEAPAAPMAVGRVPPPGHPKGQLVPGRRNLLATDRPAAQPIKEGGR